MAQPDIQVKALVPYGFVFDDNDSKSKQKRLNMLDKALGAVSDFYNARFKLYASFLFIFFILSAFSYGMIHSNFEFGSLWLDSILDSYSSSSFGVLYYLQSPVLCLPFRTVAYLGGFTCFAFPVAVLSAVRVLFSQCVLFSLVSYKLPNLVFYNAFAFIVLFALQILIDICYFSETVRFGMRFRKGISAKCAVVYTVTYFTYVLIICFLSNLQMSLI